MLHDRLLPFASKVGHHLFVVDGSRIYDIDATDYAMVDADPAAAIALLGDGPADWERRYIDARTPALPPMHALSLNVAQSCNLACGYCYAGEGRFGGNARLMDDAVALDAVRLLLHEAQQTKSAVLGFMGGEPLLNRRLLRTVTDFAAGEAARRGIRLRFSLTTNATLLSEEDAAFLSAHRFTVAVSLDGPPDVNDAQRPDHRGRGSFERTRRGLDALLVAGGCHVSARATVTPRTGRLLPLLEALFDLGVDEAGFAPVLVSPNPAHAFAPADFGPFLQHMTECGVAARDAILARRRFPFSNFETGILEIARGSHRPYSCSAAAGYGSVDADGSVFGCHRGIGDEAFAIGSVKTGLDNVARSAFLEDRHVLRQEPCNSCWARFLCGGGCHHEVLARGRPGCNYIRGWLRFLLTSYVELSELAPTYIADPQAYFANSVKERGR